MSRVELTDEQERSVTRRSEPLLLSAAAGSGKTSVLVERFVRAVHEDGLAPGRILAITFTDRAAGELRERVRGRFLEMGEREAARDTEAAFVGTFHAFCARLLRAHPLLAGLDPDFAILEEGRAGRLRERAYASALRDFLEGERGEAVDLLAAYGVDRVRAMIESVHATLRSRGQRSPRLPVPSIAPSIGPGTEAEDEDDADSDSEAAALCGLLGELLVGFDRAYEQLKRDRRAVDFDDLELCARELLEQREVVRMAWSERFEMLMVDEFQDTNPRQLAVLRALDRGNLFTVGDELQSIYGFRDADVRLFRARREELAERGGSLALRSNFRSRAAVLDVVNTVFQDRFAGFAPLLAAREEIPAPGEQLQLYATAEAPAAGGALQEPAVELLLSARSGWEGHTELAGGIARGLPPAPLWRQAEARLLAQRVAQLVQDGQARAGEVAILLRALVDLEVYERALQLHGLRTLAAVGAFWDHQQIGDLLAYLRALANPLEEEALYATLASPLVGVSRDGLALLSSHAREQRRGVWETARGASGGPLGDALAERDRAALGAFCERLAEERRSAPRRTLSALIERALDASAYRQHALTLDWGERRLANIHKLLRVARRYEADEGRDLRGFLDHVAHLRGTGGGGESDAPVDGVEPDAVRLMSIHAAKGLEFSVVCVADLGRAPNTRMPDLLVEEDRIGLQLVRLDGAKSTPTLDFAELCEERRRAEAEEEDRILYVAMTRARDRLLLSGAVDFERWPEGRPGGTPISWLGPALAAELPMLAQAAAEHAPWVDLRLGASGSAIVRCRMSSAATVGAVLRIEPEPEGERDRAAEPGARPDGSPEAEPRLEEGASEEQAPEPPPGRTGAGSGPAKGEPGGKLEGAAALSYTSLSELERCGYRYYLERVLRMGEDRQAARASSDGRSLQARARGTLVHRLLEMVDFAEPGGISHELIARVARELGVRLAPGEREEVLELIDTASRSAPAARVAGALQVRREHPFAFSVGAGEPLITGVMDLLAREADGGFVVFDYKSDRVDPDTDLEAVVERDYALQRLLYALAVLRDGAPSVEIVHWFLHRPEEWVAARFPAAERVRMEASLSARLAAVRAHGFDVSPSPHRGLCLTCPGRGGLCSWSERETLRERPHAPGAAGETLLAER